MLGAERVKRMDAQRTNTKAWQHILQLYKKKKNLKNLAKKKLNLMFPSKTKVQVF